MRPTLWEGELLGYALNIGAYSGMLVAGTVLAVATALLLAWRARLPLWRFALFLAVSALAIPVGARLLHAVLNPAVYRTEPERLTELAFTGFALYGGLVLAAVTGVVAARVLRLDLWRSADACAPALVLGIVMARLGCFQAGCCFGRPWDGWAAVEFPAASPAHYRQLSDGAIGFFDGPLPVHPTQLYEAAGALIALVLALVLVRALRLADGSRFLLTIAGFTVVRWLDLRLFRVMPPSFEPEPWFYPMLYGGIVAASVALVVVRTRNAKRGTVTP